MKQKKVPERTCIACREIKSKKELIRIVCNKDGEIAVDVTGKMAGRGAYICPKTECFEKCEKAHLLEKAFSCTVPKETYTKLDGELKALDFH